MVISPVISDDDEFITVTVAVAFMEELTVLVAVTVTVPAAFAVTLPPDTVATDGFEEVQVTLADALEGFGVTLRSYV